MGKSFEEFEPVFGEAKAEWLSTTAYGQPHQLLPFLFHVHALDHSRLRIHLTDFHSYTWEGVRTVQHLEDLREIIGVGGSWEEFIDYLIASMSSDNVKLILGALNSDNDSGVASAKLVAHKSKGMPIISIPLSRLTGSAANDAIANLSLELFKAFKKKKNEVVKAFDGSTMNIISISTVRIEIWEKMSKFSFSSIQHLWGPMDPEQQRSYQLTVTLSAEQEKNESIHQMDAYKRKQQRLSASDKAFPLSVSVNENDDVSVYAPQASETLSTQSPSVHKVVPAYRRSKIRGAFLQDTEDINDS